MSILKLECDNVIVGGGLAGLIASMRLRGKTILLSCGLGATAVSGGVFTPAGDDAKAESWFLEMTGDTGCRYARGKYVTSSGIVGEGLVQASTLYEGSPLLITFNEERPGFKGVEFMKGSSLQEMARALEEDDGAAVELARRLSGARTGAMLIPPVLGVSRADEIRSRVSELLGTEVHELVAAPSALGLRLVEALRKKAAGNERLDILEIVRAERVTDGRVEGRMGTKGKREVSVRANNLLIATGGPLTGFMVSGDRVFEPLTGATVSMNIEADLGQQFLSDHPLMYKGIGPDLFINGFDNVRVIGAAACGFGLYKALVSGFHAGDGL